MTTTYKRLAYSTAASSSGSGVTVYDSFSLLPAVATDGKLAVVADEDALYQYDTVTSAWILIGKKGVVYTVSDTDTIVLTITGNSLSAIVKAGGITANELADDAVTTAKIASPTGADTNVVTGTAGTANNFSMWNIDGDLVDSSKAVPTGAVVGTSDTQTLTSKTIDGDDNTLQDLPLSSLKTVLADASKFVQRDVDGIVVSGKAVPTGDVIGSSDTQTLTNKTIDGDVNTIQDLALTSIKTVLADASKFIVRDVDGIPVSNKSVPTGDVIGSSDSQTLTNKTIDVDNNTVSNIEVDNLKSTAKTGADTKVVTGTAGTSGNFGSWNVDGDLVDSTKAVPTGAVVGTTDTQTLTGKTIDGDDNTVQDLALTTLKTVAGDANKFLQRDADGIVVANKAVPTGTVVGTSDTQTLTNKTIGDALVFTPVTSPAHSEGKLFYNETSKTFSFYNNEPDVTLNIGEELWVKARNSTGSTILNGKAVYVSGATGNRPNITLADSDSANCCEVIGLATHDIENNSDGYVTTFGEVRDLDTSAFAEGDTVYLSTTAGELTNVQPTYPASPIRIGYVLVSNPSNGVILVNVEHIQDRFILPSYIDQTLENSGFTNNSDITITYNSVSRTITLNGTFECLYKGLPILELVDGWESDPHPENPTTMLFLKYNGSGFEWTSTPWSFSEVQIAYLMFNSSSVFYFGQRETHGYMPISVHSELHKVIGTFRDSGGTLTNYTLNSNTAANRRPDTNATVVYDEDLKSTIASHTDKLYTQLYFSGALGTENLLIEQADIVPLSTNRPYFNEFTGGAWQQTLMAANSYMTIWQIAIPTTADTRSQLFRYIWLQGQSQGTLASQQALNVQDLNLSGLSNLSPEFVFINKVIIQYTAANWVLTSVTSLTGNRSIQTGSPTGNYLSIVNTDATIDGSGTVSDPLSITTSLAAKLDVAATNFTLSNNVSVAADITGLLFNPASVRSFKANIAVAIDATTDLFESFVFSAIYNGTTWNYTIESEGSDSQVILSITDAGQVQYTSANLAGFVSGNLSYRSFINS